MTVKDILIKARELITKPENWCQCTYALDNEGRTIVSWSPKATRFCAVGAIRCVLAKDPNNYTSLQLSNRLRDVVGTDPTVFNDRADHAAVMDMYDKAIANCKE